MPATTRDDKELIAATAIAVAGGASMVWLGKKLQSSVKKSRIDSVAPVLDAQVTSAKSTTQFQQLKISDIKLDIRPKFSITPVDLMDFLRTKGILGLLTGYHWDVSRARLDYMQRCKQYGWCDETYLWRIKDSKYVSEDRYLSELKRTITKPGNQKYNDKVANYYYNYAPTKGNFYWLLGKTTNYPNHRARMRSLENTFSNWSAPAWASSMAWYSIPLGTMNSDRKFPKKFIDFYDLSWCSTGTGLFLGEDIWHRCGKSLGMGASGVNTISSKLDNKHVPWYGYSRSQCNDSWGDFGSAKWDPSGPERWYEVGPINFIKASEIPHRINHTHFPNMKWKGVGFDMYNAEGIPNEAFMRKFAKYYERGYYLVNATLDFLLARGHKDLLKDFPPFVVHCVGWGINPPDAERARRFDDISKLGCKPKGFEPFSTAEIVNYVMKITPRPGTIPPWEDKGPLWDWPDEFGFMQPLAPQINQWPDRILYLRKKSSEKNESWMSGFPMRLIQLESSVLSSAVGNAAGAAIGGVVNAAMASFESGISESVSQFLNELNDLVSKNVIINEVLDFMGELSSLTSEVRKFISAKHSFVDSLYNKYSDAALSKFQIESALPQELENMLSEAVSGTERAATMAKRIVEDKIKRLEDYWEWTDDLIGSVSSYGKDINDAIYRVR